DFPTPTVVTPDGDLVIIAGTTGDPWASTSNITAIAYRTDTGEPAWTSTYEGPANGNDFAAGIALSPDGETFYVTGSQDDTDPDPATPGDLAVVAIDATTGDVKWSASRPGGAGTAVAAGDESVFVTGAQGGDLVIAAYEAGTGAERWAATLDGDGHGDDTGLAIGTAAGRVFITGRLFVSGSADIFDEENDRDMVTLAHDAATGQRLWRRDYDSEAPEWSWEEGDALLLSPDGSLVYVSGRSHFAAHSALIAYDAETGDEAWHRLLAFSSLTGVALTPSGHRLFLTGLASSNEFGIDRTAAYDARTGIRQWQADFSGSTDGGYAPVGYDVVVSPDGSTVYVAGVERQEFPPLTWDFVTTAYDVDDGEEQWYAHYNSSRIKNDRALAYDISITPDGETVFTSGIFSGTEFGATQRGWGLAAYDVDDGVLPEAGCSIGHAGEQVPLLCSARPPSLEIGGTAVSHPDAAPCAEASTSVVATRCESWVGTHDTPWNHGSPAYGLDVPFAMAVSEDSVFVTGFTLDMESGTFAIATAAFDAKTGERRWSTLHVPRYRPYSQPFGIAVSPDGTRVYVTGLTNWDAWVPSKGSFLTVAYDAATGREVWESAYHGTEKKLNVGIGVAVSPDGEHVYATGVRDAENNNQDLLQSSSGQLATISYDAETGDREWLRSYGGEGEIGTSIGHAIAVDDDAVYITGPSKRGTDYEMTTIAYRAGGEDAGEELWASRHDRPNDDVPIAMARAGDRVFLAGWHVDDPASGATSFDTVALDAATGDEAWNATYGSGSDGPAYPTGLAVGSNGAVHVTGYAVNTLLWGGTTVSYDGATGAQRWAVREPAAARSAWQYFTPTVAVSPNGARVYVAGQQEVNAQGLYLRSDAVTTAYDAATGDRVWLARYNGGDALTDVDSSVGVGVSPDGTSVFTAAWFTYAPSEDGNVDDFGVLAYPA
ncbi:MAG TPA: PQQ-binding-like beta-propeller repeat protein, partial [Actinomycetota bacterium]